MLFLAQAYFWRRTDGRKEHAEKEGKAACKRKINVQEEKQHGKKARNPIHDRVRFFDKGCNGYKLIK
jgi:hypothetical protein